MTCKNDTNMKSKEEKIPWSSEGREPGQNGEEKVARLIELMG